MKLQGHKWRTLYKQFRNHAHARNEPCWICGRPIDWNAVPQSAAAFELDHALPRSTHPDLAWEITNMRTSHSACNRKRGNLAPITPSKHYRWTPANW